MFGIRTTALVVGLALGAAPFLNVASATAGQAHSKGYGYGQFRGGAYSGGHYPSYNARHGWRPKYSGHHTRRHKHGIGRTGAAILGVGVGLLVANAIDKKARRAEERAYRSHAPYPAPVVYSQALSAPQTQAHQATESPCLQTREYQTTITVGGEQRAAYGSACLMPDGSWMMGKAIPEPLFD